jgi:LPXTG-motif cell wall-anchored protein
MMKHPKAILFLIFSVLASLSYGQSGTSVQATVDKNRILIGERVNLRLEANIPENQPIRFFLIDSIPHFEIVEKTRTDTINTNSGTRLIKTIPLTSFDSGHWVIPSFEMAGGFATDTIPMDVVFSVFDPNQPYHDIKDIIEVSTEEKTPWWWYAAGGLLLLLIIVYLLTRKKKKAVVVSKEITVDPYAEAMESLKKLQIQKPDPAKFHRELTNIFRIYVFRRKNILSLQKTTDDLVIQLRSIGMNKEGFDKLAQCLRMSDFVKFAKYIPSPEDDQDSLETIRRSIEEIEKLN